MDEHLDAARAGDSRAFELLISPHRSELERHCYRMLGSAQDAEDALQEALVAAWRGLAGFRGRSSLRTWLFQVATNAALRVAERRAPRLLSWDLNGPWQDVTDLGRPIEGAMFVEPWSSPDDPPAAIVRRESVRLAFVAALQHLPATQRATLVLRDVLKFSAAEVAEMLDTTVPAVNSALQRARSARLEFGAEVGVPILVSEKLVVPVREPHPSQHGSTTWSGCRRNARCLSAPGRPRQRWLRWCSGVRRRPLGR